MSWEVAEEVSSWSHRIHFLTMHWCLDGVWTSFLWVVLDAGL